MGEAFFGRREAEGMESAADDVGLGVSDFGEVSRAGGGLASSPSAFLLGKFEKGRRHLDNDRGAGAGSVKAEKGDCASRRLDMVLLMALMSCQWNSDVEQSWKKVDHR